MSRDLRVLDGPTDVPEARNHFLNFKDAPIDVKWITSSSQTRIQVAVYGTDLPTNFFLRICMSRISCLRLLPFRKQAMPAGLLKLEIRQHSAEESFQWSPPRELSSWLRSPTR